MVVVVAGTGQQARAAQPINNGSMVETITKSRL